MFILLDRVSIVFQIYAFTYLELTYNEIKLIKELLKSEKSYLCQNFIKTIRLSRSAYKEQVPLPQFSVHWKRINHVFLYCTLPVSEAPNT